MAEIATQQQAVEWYRIVTDWPNIWSSVQRNFQGLLAQSSFIQTQPAEVRAWYDARVRRASQVYQQAVQVQNTLNSIKSQWDVFTGWLRGTVGMSSLGLLPLIPVAITAASAAAIIVSLTSWLRESSQDSRTIDLLKEGRAQGLTPAQAVDIVTKTRGGSPSGTFFGINIKWLLLGAAALIIIPVVLPMLKRGK